MIADHQFHAVTHWLSECQRPLLLSHRRPDGDALGSLAGMSRALQTRGAKPSAVLFEPFPSRYAMLEGATQWLIWDQVREPGPLPRVMLASRPRR